MEEVKYKHLEKTLQFSLLIISPDGYLCNDFIIGIRAQLEALGIDAGSSLSSLSESNTIEEFDASLAKHDEIFSSEDMKPTEEEAAKPKNSDVFTLHHFCCFSHFHICSSLYPL